MDRKGFSSILIIVLIVLLVLAGAVFYFMMPKTTSAPATSNSANTNATPTTVENQSTNSGMLSQSDKDQIIAIILSNQAAIASGDVGAMRSNIMATGDEASKAQIQKATDDQLLQLSKFFVSAGIAVTETQLRASSTEWIDDNGTITVNVSDGDNSTTTLHAVQENGQWKLSEG